MAMLDDAEPADISCLPGLPYSPKVISDFWATGGKGSAQRD